MRGSVISAIDRLPVWQHGNVTVVIETPKGSANKIKYRPDLGLFALDRTLPAGMSFPFDFGFVPRTLAADSDPLDAIVILDAPAYPGCVVAARVLGVIVAEQQDGEGPWIRNDRLVTVPSSSVRGGGSLTIDDMDTSALDAIEAFFVAYHRFLGNAFRVVRRGGVVAAREAIRAARRDVSNPRVA